MNRRDDPIDDQIRRAEKEGLFRDLPKGPIPGAGQPDDENWWIKDKLKREGLSIGPAAFELRRRVEQLREALAGLSDEEAVAREVEEINSLIRRANQHPTPLGMTPLVPLDLPRELSRRRSGRAARGPGGSSPPPPR